MLPFEHADTIMVAGKGPSGKKGQRNMLLILV
jgi:hypothetical protein